MKKIKNLGLLVACAVGTSIASVPAAPVIYEPFADSEATLTGNTPGTGLTGTWALSQGTSWTVSAGSLSFGSPPLPASDRKAQGLSQGAHSITTGTVASNSLKNAGLLENGATLWFSFLWQMDAAVVSNGDAGFSLGTDGLSGANAIPMLSTNGGNGIGVSLSTSAGNVSASTWAGNTRTSGGTTAFDRTQARLVVGKIVWGADASTADTVTIYIPASDLALPAAAASTRSAILDQSKFNTISFATKNEGDPLIDEIRFGASYFDVIGAAPTTAAYWDPTNDTAAGTGSSTPTGTWDTGNKWNPLADGTGTAAAWVANQAAVFAAGTDATGTYAVTVDSTQQIGGLTFEEGTVTLSGGTALDLASAGGTLELRQPLGSATISTPISQSSGSGALYKDGSGTLTLSGDNTYDSTTIVASGKLILSGDNSGAAGAMTLAGGVTQFDSTLSIPGSGTSVTVGSSAVAMFGSALDNSGIAAGLARIAPTSPGIIAPDNNAGDDFNLSTAGLTAAYFGAVGNVTYTGTLTPNGNYRLGGGGGALTLSNTNALTGAAKTLTVSGPGTVILSGNNNYTGGTTINSGGTVIAGSANSMHTAGSVTLNGILRIGASTAFTGGDITIANNGQISSDGASNRSIASRLVMNGTFTLGDTTNNGKLTFVTSTTSTTGSAVRAVTCHSDVEFAVPLGGTGGINKLGLGTLTLSGNNGYSGGTTIGGGTLVLDYGSGQDNTKLSDSGALTLDGGSIVLKGGTHPEQVGSTVFGSANATPAGTFISLDSRTAPIKLKGLTTRNVTTNTLALAAENIATTDTPNNSTGILGAHITVGSHWAINSTGGSDASITAYSGYTPFVNATGDYTKNYQLLNGDALTGNVVANTLRIEGSADNQELDLGSTYGITMANITTTATAPAVGSGGILYDGGASNRVYTITGSKSTQQLTCQNGNGQGLLINTFRGTLNVNCKLFGGNSPLIKTGAGTLALGGASGGTLTGAIRVYQGVLRLSNADAAGTTAAGIVIQNGAALELASNVALGAEALTITGTGVSATGALRNPAGNSSTYGGLITIGTGGARINSDLGGTLNLTGGVITDISKDLTISGAGDTTVSSVGISGAGGIFKTGNGILTLSFANSYAGTTAINGGTLKLGANNVLPDGGAVSIGAATLDSDTRTDSCGTLDVTAAATINLGSSAALVFADSNGIDWTGGTLNITGTFVSGSSIRFGTNANGLTTAQKNSISVNGSGAGTYSLDASGYLVSSASPTITLTGTLGAVDTTYGSASPTPTSFTVAGSSLTGAPGNLTVAPPAGYEVSLSSGASYTTSLSVPYGSATLASTTVYVRLAAMTTVGSYSGNITVSGGGATSQTIATASSTVSARALTFTGTKTIDGNASATAAQLVFGNNLDGANLTKSGSVTLAGSAAGPQAITDFSGLTLGGSAAGNYTLTGASGTVTILTAYEAWLADNSKTDTEANQKEYAFGTTNAAALVLNEAGTSIVSRGQAPIITTTVGSAFVKLTYARRKNSGFAFAAQYSTDLETWLASNDASLIYHPDAPAGESVVDNGDEMEIVSINFPVFRDTGTGIVKMLENFSRITVTP